jgi:hypothetical protein
VVFKITPSGTLTVLAPINGDISGASKLVQGVDGKFYGTSYGSSCVFVVDAGLPPLPSEPTTTTLPATAITANSATGAGQVNPNGAATQVWFEYGVSPSYTGSTSAVNAGSGRVAETFSASLTGLPAHTQIHYAIVAQNNKGMTSGADTTFTTTDSAPLAYLDEVLIPTGKVTPVIEPLVNDSDPDGDPLTITEAGRSKFGVTLINGANTGNTITYTPSPNYAGSDSFSYTISDGFGKTATSTVNISSNPFALRAGEFIGLITGSDGSVDGTATLTLTKTGAFTDAFLINGAKDSGTGAFDQQSGNFISADSSIHLHLDLSGTANKLGDFVLSGTIATISSTQAIISAFHTAYSLTEIPREAGNYTALLTSTGTSLTAPPGTGYGILNVTKGGISTMFGKLADNVNFSASRILVGGTAGNRFIIYETSGDPSATTEGAKESFIGSVTFEKLTGSDFDGTPEWVKPQQSRGNYPAAFDTRLNVIGSLYTRPTNGGSALPGFASGTLALSDTGTLSVSGATPLDKMVTLTSTNALTITNPSTDELTVTITPSTGVFRGTFLYPVTGGEPKLTDFSGVLFQDQTMGGGLFLGPSGGGTVSLTPGP